MQIVFALVALVATSVLATPVATKTSAAPVPTVSVIYGPGHHVINSSCPKLHPSKQPLGPSFPIANQLGSQIGPVLAALVGNQTVEDIDIVADQLCVSAEQSGEGTGICQETFAAARAFVDAKTPLAQSKEFGCLLNLICIANTGPNHPGTCNYLLAGADCVANRIAGVEGVECTGKK